MKSYIGGYILPDNLVVNIIKVNNNITLLNTTSISSSSYSITSSYLITSKFALSSSFTTRSLSSSFSNTSKTSSFIENIFDSTQSFVITSSNILTNKSASFVLSASQHFNLYPSSSYSITASWASSSITSSYSLGALDGKFFNASKSIYIPYDGFSRISNTSIQLGDYTSSYISCSVSSISNIIIVVTSSLTPDNANQNHCIGGNIFISKSLTSGLIIGHDVCTVAGGSDLYIGNKIFSNARNMNVIPAAAGGSGNSTIIGNRCLTNFNFLGGQNSQNTIVGNFALGNTYSGSVANTVIGNYAGFNADYSNSNPQVLRNTFIGNYSGYNCRSSYNTFIGNYSGYNFKTYTSSTTSSGCVTIGYRCGFSYTSSMDNTILIGNNIGIGQILAGGSNTVAIGNNIETNGKVGCIILGHYASASANFQFVLGSPSNPIQTSSIASVGSQTPTLISGSQFLVINLNGTLVKIPCFNL